jgi:hypothetical protein
MRDFKQKKTNVRVDLPVIAELALRSGLRQSGQPVSSRQV